MKKIIKKIVSLLLMSIVLISIFFIYINFKKEIKQENAVEQIKEDVIVENYKEEIYQERQNEEIEIVAINKEIEENTEIEKQEETMSIQEKEISAKKYTSIYNENAFIDGHLISYPVFASQYATLKISKINVDAPIFFGTTNDLLLEGVCHDMGSYFSGENGAIIMCGHNYKNNFKRLRRTCK